MQDFVLEIEYAAAAQRARRLVSSRFSLEVCSPESPDYPPPANYWREVWFIEVPNLQSHIQLIVAIPKNFPDQLPKVYVPSTAVDPARPLPHLDSRLLCTFDADEVVPNCDVHPGSIVLDVIERAVQIWQDGITEANLADFKDEFEAYWAKQVNNLVLSLVEPTECVRKIAALYLVREWNGHRWLVAPTATQGKQWLANVGYRDKVRIEAALYLPLKDFGYPLFPITNRDLHARLKEYDPVALKQLIKFLSTNVRPSGVLFSVPTDEVSRAMGMWWHPPVFYETYRGTRSSKQRGVIRGFRPGPLAARMELIAHHGNQEIVRSSVTRVDPTRLLRRTAGVGREQVRDPISIIGCGSIGSLLAESLARSGTVSNLRLIDPERLAVENVMRHLCGMAEVGEYKATAVAKKIGYHFPHISCAAHPVNVLDLLRESPQALESSSLCIVAVGSYAIERRLNRLMQRGIVGYNFPLCFAWVEPHLYGGHALLIQPTRPGCFECTFNEDMLFQYRIIDDPRHFAHREAGCQTTYMPYSGAMSTHFVSSLAQFLVTARETEDNVVWSWAGDLDEARRANITLQDEWQHARSFTTRQVKITASSNCPSCTM